MKLRACHLISVSFLLSWLAGIGSSSASDAAAQPLFEPRAIVQPAQASPSEALAAREVRRYLYLRTGRLLPIEAVGGATMLRSDAILVCRKDRVQLAANAASFRATLPSLAPQQYLLRTTTSSGRRLLLLVGADDAATLHAAYRFAEHLGVRFYLHGDVLPTERIPLRVPPLDELGKPLFRLRGIQPFHDFPEGPDWWNRDDYLAIISQLPKLRMNFIGLHTYPEERPDAEPTVWIGPPSEIGEGGRVKASYPTSYHNTLRGNWGYAAKKTSDYACGAAALFERDDFGADVMVGATPHPATTAACDTLFEQTAGLLRAAFEQAHRLGVKTCVGTETPLVVPRQVAQRLETQGKSVSQRQVIEELYEGIFRRAAQAYPLDYYWFWTPEGWTWEATKPEQVIATTNDLAAAIAAWNRVQPPFSLATCGWVLGPQLDRALFDKVLPPTITVSCINREVGKTPVDRAFADVKSRSKWAIPWLEDDPGLTIPQLWVGRMRRDAFDALRYGCDGLLGIHWRTRVLGPAISALAQAAWSQAPWRDQWTPDPPSATNFPPVADFYADWTAHEFGRAVGARAAAVFARIDGRLPRPADWVGGPGGIRPDRRSWDQVSNQYAFVDEFTALAPEVRGFGEHARFAWWLNTFQYLRSMGQVNCTWARFTNAFAGAKAATSPQERSRLAREQVLPVRRELVRQTAEGYRHLLATVSNPGEFGTVANFEQHMFPDLLDKPGRELAELLGEELPADAQLPRSYQGPTRLIVPTVRTSFLRGESLSIKVCVLAEKPSRELTLYWRRLGRGRFTHLPLRHVARGVYRAEFPSAATRGEDVEYYVECIADDGKRIIFPATAPKVGQTLVATD